MNPDDPRLLPYDPELYDLTHRGNPGDLGFYVQACQGANRVLELGCGTGRITRALARAGCQVTGLDSHPGMLAEARRIATDLAPEVAERLTYVQGDMRHFELEPRFDRITIPYNGLYCLLSDGEVAACFSAVHRHLALDGALILDAYRVFSPDPDYEPEPDSDEPMGVLTDGPGTLQIFERTDWDQPAQRLDAWYRYRLHGPDGVTERTYCIPQRYLYPDQLHRLLAAADLNIKARHGDYDRRPFDDDADIMVVIATRA